MIGATRTATHLAAAASVAALIAVAARSGPALAWAGAVLIAVTLARAATVASSARSRGAGLEMRWLADARTVRVARGGEVLVRAEITSRSPRPTRLAALRALTSRQIVAACAPAALDLAPGARAVVEVRVRALRVGRHAVHALAFEAEGPLGLFEVPLTFASPLGVEVVPRGAMRLVAGARGGRGRRGGQTPASRREGDGAELRELREWAPGDPFRRIAWKPSARRGRLLVRALDQDEHETVWLVLDACSERGHGAMGDTPLDRSIDALAATAAAHASRGDRVGVAVLGARPLAWAEPHEGPAQAALVARLLGAAFDAFDEDRSAAGPVAVVALAREHLALLGGNAAAPLDARDPAALAREARRLAHRAPFDAPSPRASHEDDATLRRHLAAFGVALEATPEMERAQAGSTLALALERLAAARPRPTRVVIAARRHDLDEPRSRALRRLARRGVRVVWIDADAATTEPTRALAALGVHVERPRAEKQPPGPRLG